MAVNDFTDTRPEAGDHTPAAEADKPEGPVSAAILAAGVGSFALGLFTTLAEASKGFKEWLQWSDPVGPLSGKTTLAVIVWLVSWVVLHVSLRGRTYETRRALTIALVLIALGVLGTFPTFFEAFAAE
ncbi:MAG TPA: hypothetical protein VFM55_15910 [Micromonosporaceae bacterium]|nr:hypothetical protein [Micromonosporaceae bacterium]